MSKLNTLSLDQLSTVSGGVDVQAPVIRPRIPLVRPPSLAELIRRIPGLWHKTGATSR